MNGFKEFFVETYDLDLLMEFSTLGQTLKQHQDQELVKIAKTEVSQGLMSVPFFQTPIGKKMFSRYVNFFSYHILQDKSLPDTLKFVDLHSDQNPRFALSPTELKQTALKGIGQKTVNTYWRRWGDYFVAMGDKLASKLNTAAYTFDVIDQESEQWHEEIAVRERGLPDQEVKTFLTLDHIGKEWRGWKWVDLEKGSCSKEAEAMGHCGNSGAATGDNIISLRDSEGYAHLTFIVNDGFLGEAKGRANNKPSEKYHKPIVELLKSKHIESIKGGGYKPQNNFSFNDLHDDHKKELEHKSNINDPFNHIIEKYKGDPKKMVGGVNEMFNSSAFERFDGTNFTLEVFKGRSIKRQRKDGAMYDAWISPFEEIEDASKAWQKESHVKWLDDAEPQDAYHGMSPAELISILNAENKKRITDYLRDEVKDFDEHDLDDLIGEDEDIMQALDFAAGDTQSSADLGEAHNDVRKQLGTEDENGFFIDFNSEPWALKISLDSVKSLYTTMTNDDADGMQYDSDVEDYIALEYDPPRDGHYGTFNNEHYNENVADRLYEVIR